MARRGNGRAQDDGALRLHGHALTPSLLAATAVCRALHDGAALMLFGAALFAATLVPASLGREASRRVRRIAGIAVPLLVVTALIRVPLAAAALGEGWPDAVDPATLRAALVETAFGRSWILHGAAVALLLPSGRRPLQLACLSGLAVASLALVGHPAQDSGVAGWLGRATLALHLLAAGAWIGSLPEVMALMRRLSADRPDGDARPQDAALALHRFSTAGHAAVALVIATGVADALEISGAPRALLGSAYGLVLGGKAALALGMAGLAATNRYHLVPCLRRDPTEAGRALVRNTRAVLVLGLGAVAAAGLLGLLDPP